MVRQAHHASNHPERSRGTGKWFDKLTIPRTIPSEVEGLANWQTKRGFTFIELLITTVLTGIIALVIYSALSQGVKIWQRLNQKIYAEDINIFSEKFSRDLKNNVKFNTIKFSGTKDELRFATLVNSQSKLSGLKVNVGEVTYAFDRRAKAVTRRQKNFSQLYRDEPGLSSTALREVESLNFQYYFYDARQKEYLWQEEWIEQDLPIAVRIELKFNDGADANKFTQNVSIPISR